MGTALMGNVSNPVAKVTVEAGSPVDRIVEAGKEHDVILVSDSGKSCLKRFIVDSVACGVMGRSETSVLNLR